MAVRLKIGELIEKAEINQSDLAIATGLTRNTISKLVNQPAQVRLDTLDLLCESLQCEPGDLFERVIITKVK